MAGKWQKRALDEAKEGKLLFCTKTAQNIVKIFTNLDAGTIEKMYAIR